MKCLSSLKKYSESISHIFELTVVVLSLLLTAYLLIDSFHSYVRTKDIRPMEELMQEQVQENPIPAIETKIIFVPNVPRQMHRDFEHARQKEEELMQVIKPTPKPETTKDMLIRIANQVCDSYDFYPELPKLVQAVIEVESNYRLDVVSSAGCIGPMQISPFWQADRMHKLKVTDLTDPYSNILVGVDLLEDLYYNYSNQSIELTLMMYNMDFKSARAIWSSGQVTAYCSKVLYIYDSLKGG